MNISHHKFTKKSEDNILPKENEEDAAAAKKKTQPRGEI